MVDADDAVALMGNHEFNALCFHEPHPEGGHLRPHLAKNIVQHSESLRQFHNNQEDYSMYLDWFRTLPLFYETDTFRAVHAAWDTASIPDLQKLAPGCVLNSELLLEASTEGTVLHLATELILQGAEMTMPNGLSFHDKDGNRRTQIRTKWWENPAMMTYRSISVMPNNDLPEDPLTNGDLTSTNYYRNDERPVFFGYYWLKGSPQLQKPNVCCFDYSVATGGDLVAYCFDEEQVLDQKKLIWV